MEGVESKATVTDHNYEDLNVITKFQQRMEKGESMQSDFNIGWVETDKENKGRKREMKKKTAGVEVGSNRPTQDEKTQPKATWTRINRPVMGKEETVVQKEGPKRKNST